MAMNAKWGSVYARWACMFMWMRDKGGGNTQFVIEKRLLEWI